MNYPIYCINLKERKDRKIRAEKEFNKIDIQPNDVIFLNFFLHKKGGIYGCYDSHMKVWNDFYTNHSDKEMCIVFEDDIEVNENSKLYLKKAIQFIKKNNDKIDILFLHNFFFGDNNSNYKNKINNKYFINGYGYLTHAYIITTRYIKSILEKNNNKLPKPNGIHLDTNINCNRNNILYSENIYFCKNPVFTQKDDSESNNYNNIIEKIIKKKYGNNIMFNFGKKIVMNIKKNIVSNDDAKTKKIVMLLNKIYVFN